MGIAWQKQLKLVNYYVKESSSCDKLFNGQTGHMGGYNGRRVCSIIGSNKREYNAQ